MTGFTGLIFRKFIILLLALCFLPLINIAQAARPLIGDTRYEPVIMPVLKQNSVFIDDDAVLPSEPNIPVVKFMRIPEPRGYVEEVNALMFGITTDIQPEHDHYGHEIRRYMMQVGGLGVYEDRSFLIEQIKNVRKARVIANYWKKDLEAKISEIEKSHEGNNEVPLSVRTAFKQNSLAVKTFLIVLQSWIDANERVLMFVYNNPAILDIDYPEIIIYATQERLDFYNIYSNRQTKLKDMRGYHPFEMMVY